jgi:predicted acylesterase/phospholipase RssA
MNGILMEVGFLRRLRESVLWQSVGWLFGTSSGALSGAMAAIDRLADLEEFLLELRPEETFRPNRLWRLPLLGTHDYVLPRTVEERLGDPVDLARALRAAEREVVVLVTDITMDGGGFERAYSSRSTEPEELAGALLASAAMSALVLPRIVGDRVATDGGWVRNYPLGYAYDRPQVERIVGFLYEPRYPAVGAGAVAAVAARLRRYGRLPAARALVEELELAAEREARGEPAHTIDTFVRLSRVAIQRNTALEEHLAAERDSSIGELASLRDDVLALVPDEATRAAVAARFAAARFPFRHDRLIPRLTVVGSAGDLRLEQGFRKTKPWTREAKEALIERGYELADDALRTWAA